MDRDNVTNLLGLARTAEMAENNEEATSYYNRVLELDPRCSEAWLGKGKAVAWASSLKSVRLQETIVAFRNAIGSAPDDQQRNTAILASDELNKAAAAIYSMAQRHLAEFASVDQVWVDFLGIGSTLINALKEAGEWNPGVSKPWKNIELICREAINGHSYFDRIHRVNGLRSITPQYEVTLSQERDIAIEKIKEVEPEYTAPPIKKQNSGQCFVVTATMGGEDHSVTKEMRQFRDEWLARRRLGRALIRSYYKWGPYAAVLISRRKWLRWVSREMIVLPAARIARIVTAATRSK